MPDRRFTYKVNVDTSSVRAAARTMRKEIQGSLRNIQVEGTAGGRGGRGGGIGGGIGGLLGGGLLAGGGLFGFQQIRQAFSTYVVEAGKVGAENMRLRESFFSLSESAGLAGGTILSELRPALNNAVDDMTLMAETNLLLVAAQNDGVQVTEEQIGQLGRLALIRSRELTAQGRALTAQEAYARIIRGIVKRETEILDELGLSTKLLANTLGVSTKEVNNSVDSLLAAILKVAEQEENVERTFDTVADAIEQAQARNQTNLNLMKEDMAQFALAYESFLSELTAAGGEFLGLITRRGGSLFAPGRGVREGFGQAISDLFDELNQDLPASTILEMVAAEEMLADAAASTSDALYEQAETFSELLSLQRDLGSTAEELARIYGQIVEQESRGMIDPDEAERLKNVWATIVNVMDMGGHSVAQLNAMAAVLAQLLGDAADEATRLGQQFPGFATGLFFPEDISQGDIDAVRDRFIEALIPKRLGAVSDVLDITREGEFGRADTAAQISLLRESLDINTMSVQEYAQTQQQILNLEQRLAEENAAALKQNTAALERAAGQFESAISKIPGVFGLSEVTQQQLKEAQLGIPQNFPDDYIRRLTDEVLNGVDWEGVDLKDAARRAGIDPRLPARAQLELIRQSWESGAFFADPANLALLNTDAVRAHLEEQRKQQLGRQNQLQFLRDLGFADLFDEQGFKDLTTPIATQMSNALPSALRNSPIAQNSMNAIQSGFSDDIVVPSTNQIADVMTRNLYNSFDEKLGELPFADLIMGWIYRDMEESQRNTVFIPTG